MVQTHLRLTRRVPGAALAAAALTTLLATVPQAGCGRDGQQEAFESGDVAQLAIAEVRARYRTGDAAATGAWTWTSPDGTIYVLVDVQSTVEDVVQGRLDLWSASAAGTALVGRSAAMPLAASFEAYAFEEITGDSLPDFFGSVVDSTETAYAVFFPGAPGLMVEELEMAAAGWRLSTDPATMPEVVRGVRGGCALRLWADAPAPDGQSAGWRYVALLRGGQLAPPRVAAPACLAATGQGP